MDVKGRIAEFNSRMNASRTPIDHPDQDGFKPAIKTLIERGTPIRRIADFFVSTPAEIVSMGAS